MMVLLIIALDVVVEDVRAPGAIELVGEAQDEFSTGAADEAVTPVLSALVVMVPCTTGLLPTLNV
jgi:hypothetical protein